MTSYHLHVSGIFGRSANASKSAVAEGAYMDRAQWLDEKTGRLTINNTKDDKGRNATGDVLFSGLFIDPKLKPSWLTGDPKQFWNYVSSFETRKDAREAQGMIADFPDGLTQQQREFALKDFIRKEFTRKGYAVHAVIHKPSPGGDSRNYHIHLLWALREITPKGLGRRLPEITPDRLRSLRASWADACAHQLEKVGKKREAERHRWAHKTLPDQKLDAIKRKDLEWADFCDREPTRHEGPGATAKRRRGERTAIGDYNDAVRLRNRVRLITRRASRTQSEIAYRDTSKP